MANVRPRSLRSELRRRLDILAVIAAGGALGSLGRWGLAEAVPLRPGGFPWATFTVNLSGALVLGVLVVLVDDVLAPSRYLRPFVAIGILGGYTTFSTYMLETRSLAADGHAAMAATYLFGSLICGLFAVRLGLSATRLVLSTPWRQR